MSLVWNTEAQLPELLGLRVDPMVPRGVRGLLQVIRTSYCILSGHFSMVTGLELVLQPGVVTLAYTVLPPQEIEARGSQVQSQHGLNSTFKQPAKATGKGHGCGSEVKHLPRLCEPL